MADEILWDGSPISMVSLGKTKLDLQNLDFDKENETQYSEDLPLYLRTIFPALGTTKLGHNKENVLFLNRKANAYLFR